MIGPYYRPQITSMLSITHRITGVILSVVTAPLLVWLAVALARGDSAWITATSALASLPGLLALALSAWSLSFHLLNGVRHLAWDAGWGLELRTAKATGWGVLIGSVLLAVLIWGLAS